MHLRIAVLFCRNVLICFLVEMQQHIFTCMNAKLKRIAYTLLGASSALDGLDELDSMMHPTLGLLSTVNNTENGLYKRPFS